jgi:hypothetical protein
MTDFLQRLSTKYAFYTALGLITLLILAVVSFELVLNSRISDLEETLNQSVAQQQSDIADNHISDSIPFLNRKLFNPLYSFDMTSLNEEVNHIKSWLGA